MFTGIIQETGSIQSIEESGSIKTVTIHAPQTVKLLKIGDSVSVDGTCLTVTTLSSNEELFTVEIIPETVVRTICGTYTKGTIVNLEPAMQMTDRFHGHFVTGHIDGLGKIFSKTPDGGSVILGIRCPNEMMKYLSMKGSITINGVSLTVSKLLPDGFEISLIPHTLKNTTLNQLENEMKVNLEIDLIARYLNRLVNAKEQESNYFFLKERGFI